MTIPVTRVHYLRVVDQCMNNVPGLQRDILRNAQAWIGYAQAQAYPVETLAGMVASAIGQINLFLGCYTALQADPVYYAAVIGVLGQLGGQESDITEPVAAMAAVVSTLAAADMSSYAAIEVACNAVVAAVQPPLSLWPE